MAKVNVVSKQVKMGLDDIVKFQLITHCYINHISLSDLDLDCLINLSKIGSYELTDFCKIMAEKRLEDKLKSNNGVNKKNLHASPQTIRNILIKLEKENLIIKDGSGRKKITVNPEFKIQTEGNILLQYKFVHIEAKKD